MNRFREGSSRFVVLCALALCLAPAAHASDAPLLRMKTGFSSLTVNAGERVKSTPLGSALTLQPSVLWEVPEFSARMGVSFLMEMGSAYGMTPLTGIGFTGYYYVSGISTSYRIDEDGTLMQRSRPGIFLAGSLTPANFNMNRFVEGDAAGNFYFSRQVIDLSTGVGYDYPLSSNMLVAAEFMLRTGAGADSRDPNTSVNYGGYSFFLSFATSYY